MAFQLYDDCKIDATPNSDCFSAEMANDSGSCVSSADSGHRRTRGTQIKAPRGVVLVDTREQSPLDFSRFTGWFGGIERKALALGDYSVAGLEDVCVVERKNLDDLIHSFTADRSAFVERLRRMTSYPHPLLVITSSLS